MKAYNLILLIEGGDCYKLSFDYVISHPGWTLVHGIPTGTGGNAIGRQYGHAWVEKDDEVYDPSAKIKIHKLIYYSIGNIEYTVRYTKDEAMDLASKHETYGPWDKTINKSYHSPEPKRKKKRDDI